MESGLRVSPFIPSARPAECRCPRVNCTRPVLEGQVEGEPLQDGLQFDPGRGAAQFARLLQGLPQQVAHLQEFGDVGDVATVVDVDAAIPTWNDVANHIRKRQGKWQKGCTDSGLDIGNGRFQEKRKRCPWPRAPFPKKVKAENYVRTNG